MPCLHVINTCNQCVFTLTKPDFYYRSGSHRWTTFFTQCRFETEPLRNKCKIYRCAEGCIVHLRTHTLKWIYKCIAILLTQQWECQCRWENWWKLFQYLHIQYWCLALITRCISDRHFMIRTYLSYPEWWNTLTIQTQKKFIDSTKNNKYWILAGQVNFTKFVPAGQHQVSAGLEIGSGDCVSSRNSCYNTPARHGPMVSNNKAGICCVINSTMGRGVWRGLWAEKEQIFRPGSWSIPERLEDQHLPSRGGMQGICCIIYHQFAKRKNRSKGSLSPSGHQVHIKCYWKSSNWLWIKHKDPVWAAR